MYNNRRDDHRRVHEKDVPESRHTVFVRGLPGTLASEEVKSFFEEQIGPCSFDFVKVTPDKERLCVAVRFDNRETAKECMERYNNAKVLGFDVEMTWFRDIRRYVSHCQKQGIDIRRQQQRNDNRRSGYGRRSRSLSESSRSTRSRSRSRSRSRRSSRSPSSRHSSYDRDRKGREEKRSASPRKHKSKKSKKEKRRRKKTPSSSRSPSPKRRAHSDMETSDNEAKTSNVNVSQQAEMPLPPVTSVPVGQTSFVMDMDSNNPTLKQIRTVNLEKLQTPAVVIPQVSHNGAGATNSRNFTPMPEEIKFAQTEPPQIKPEEGKSNGAAINSEPPITALNNFTVIQRTILQDVRFQPPTEDNTTLGNLKLSSLSKLKSAEVVREERIARLSQEMRDRAERKKRQLELSYRQDCETYALVARKFISKDRALESTLRIVMMESMKDLEMETWKEFDSYLNELFFLNA